jgi:hypothetical protein
MTYNHITSISSLPFLFWQRFLNWLGLAVVIEIVVIALLFVVGFLVSEHFRTTGNVADIFEQMTGLAFVALGQTVVIITGGIDLSLDATIALTSSLLSGVVNGRADLAAPMIVAVLAIGITIGLVNGALILALRVHPLIITLAVAAVNTGLRATLHFDADWQHAGWFRLICIRAPIRNSDWGDCRCPAFWSCWLYSHLYEAWQTNLCARWRTDCRPPGGYPCQLGRSFRLWPFRFVRLAHRNLSRQPFGNRQSDRRYQFQFGFDHAGDLGRHTVDRRTRRRPWHPPKAF